MAAEVVKCVLTSSVSALRCALIPWLAICLGLSLRTGMIGGLMSAFYIGALATDIKGDWAEAYVGNRAGGLFLAAIRISETARLNLRSAAVLGFWWGLALLLSPALASILGSFILVGALRFLRESPRQYIQFVAVLGIGGRPGDFALADSQRHPPGKPHLGEGQLRHHAAELQPSRSGLGRLRQ